MSTTVSRRNFLRATGILGAAAGIGATLAACAPDSAGGSNGTTTAASGSANEAGTITAAISYELGTNGYDPMTTTAALTVAANWHTLEGLTEIDPATGEVYAALATEIPQTDSSSVDIKLRDGAAFSNGEPVTADDVVFSFERVLDPANNSLYASFIPFIKSVTRKDDTTVTLDLEYPSGVLAERIAVVKIVPKATVEADPAAFDTNPVGTGAYIMTDNGGASKIVKFERNDAYTGPRPARAAVMEWQIIPDASTRTNSLQSGNTMAIDSVPYLSIPQLEGSNAVESVQGFGLLFAMFNQDASNPFNDLRNRQAFLYAIDMDKVISTGMSDQATAATSFVQKEHPNYNEASTVYSLDLEKARNLFAETGLTRLRLLCTDHDWVRNCTPLIQESLVAAGVEVDFSERKSADVYNTIDGDPNSFDVVIAPGDPSVFGNDPDLLMRWWYAGDVWTDSRMHWKGSESYEEVQMLLDEGLRATDADEQQDIWNRTYDVLSENVPLYPLFHRKVPTAWNPESLVDFKPISLTGLSFVGVASTT